MLQRPSSFCAPVYFLFLTAVIFARPASATAQDAQLYFFTNPGCGPCRLVEPAIEKLHLQGFPVLLVDTQAQPRWAHHFGVTRTPTVLLTQGNRVVKRNEGLIGFDTLVQWFRSVGIQPGQQPNVRVGNRTNEQRVASANLPETVLTGTANPSTTAEQIAFDATVRLKVEDPEGISYATGTVIHRVDGESLVLTCGHVFRDSAGTGTITAEYQFRHGQPMVTTGKLIQYDAKNRDIALVAIRTSAIRPIQIAIADYPVQRSQPIFSIGCDRGQSPTIRHSKIKNIAKYNGVEKYDIYGRPVDGRSGGGLFTDDGRLIGVCNAAVVDVDEGVYTALETVHWQIAKANLTSLFSNSDSLASMNSAGLGNVANRSESQAGHGSSAVERLGQKVHPADLAVFSLSPDDIKGAGQLRGRLNGNQSGTALAARTSEGSIRPFRSDQGLNSQMQRPVANAQTQPQMAGTESELIVIYRSPQVPGKLKTWTVTNPDAALLEQLNRSGSKLLANHRRGILSDQRLAQLREQMPDLASRYGERNPHESGSNQNAKYWQRFPDNSVRAQSPK